jgi:hypothetical protein
MDEIIVYVGDIAHDDDDDVSVSSFENNLERKAEVIFIPVLNSKFSFDVSRTGWRSLRRSHLRKALEAAVTSAWGVGWDWEESAEVIGEVQSTDIVRSVAIYRPTA